METHFTKVTIIESHFANVKIIETHITRVTIIETHITRVAIFETHFSRVTIIESHFTRVTLIETRNTKASFIETHLICLADNLSSFFYLLLHFSLVFIFLLWPWLRISTTRTSTKRTWIRENCVGRVNYRNQEGTMKMLWNSSMISFWVIQLLSEKSVQ